MIDARVIYTWIELVVKLATFIIITPLILTNLSAQEAAYFFLINTVVTLGFLAEGGVNRVILRLLRYYQSGVVDSTIKYKIKDKETKKDEEDKKIKYIKKLEIGSLYLYLILGLISTILIGLVGYPLLFNTIQMQPNTYEANFAFIALGVYILIRILNMRLVAFIHGYNGVVSQKRIEINLGLVKILLMVISLINQQGVLYLVLIMLFIEIIHSYFYMKKYSSYRVGGNIEKIHKEYMLDILKPSYRQSAISLSGFIIYQTAPLVVAQGDDPVLIASFVLTYQIFQFLKMISISPVNAIYPQVVSSLAERNRKKYINLIIKIYKYSIPIYITGTLAIIFIGDLALQSINSTTTLLPLEYISLISLMYLLEVNHVIHSSMYMATNHIPFVIPSILSAVSIIVLSILFMPIYGFASLIYVQLFAQGAYNNWYPVFINLKLIKSLD